MTYIVVRKKTPPPSRMGRKQTFRPKKGLHLANIRWVENAPDILYQLFLEREGRVHISHEGLNPTMAEHTRFVENHPYRAWYMICEDEVVLGSIYFTRRNEIGVFIFKQFQHRGYATWAISTVMNRWKKSLISRKSDIVRGFVANIAPTNPESQRLFEKLGFKHVQNTLVFKIAAYTTSE